MTRVILIHQHDPTTPHVGGIGTFINTFLKYAPSDFDVSLVGVSSDPARYPLGRWHRLEMEGRSYSFFPVVRGNPATRGRVPLSLRLTWGLRRLRASIDFREAVVEFHRIEPALALQNLRNPKILFLHAHMRDLYNPKTEVMWGRLPWLYFWLEKKLISEMRQIYIVREDAVPFYQGRYPRLADRIQFFPTWVDPAVFRSLNEPERNRLREEFAQKERFDSKNRVLLFVGRFEGQKDPFLLLESFRQLNGQMGETILILIGEGSLESSIRSYVREKGLRDQVRILGSKPQSEIVQWMNVADCLCLSSAYEGMPRVVVEALQCGLAVVATKTGETQRLIQDPLTGRLVEEKAPVLFAQAIQDLLNEPPNRAACQKQVAGYTVSKILEPLYESYREWGRMKR